MKSTRGSSKTGLQYIMGIEKLYKENKINKEDYFAMIGAARVAFFNESEDEVFNWIEKQLEGEMI